MTAHISDDGSEREESVAEHTEKVVYLCREKGMRCGIPQIMSLCGMLHDMGKSKLRFDEYIHADESVRRKLRGKIGHASTGAKYIYERYHEGSDKVKILTELIAYAVAAHHGVFDCVNREQTDLFAEKTGIVEDYEEACANSQRDFLASYKPEEMFAMAKEEFEQIWDKMKKAVMQLKPLLTKGKQDEKNLLMNCRSFYFAALQRLMLSILIDSDWEATSDFMDDVDTLSKGSSVDSRKILKKAQENFQKYMEDIRSAGSASDITEREKEIIGGRNQLQMECREFAEHPAGIYCLPIPTGGGKTLSSLAYALEYCRRHPDTERIIYVSPYISITEQNAAVFREAVGQDDQVLEHHSSVVKDIAEEDEDYRKKRFVQLDMNWEEPFICTTFVQFMNTLFSENGVSIRRMHRLVNSVIIIDEVQSVPMKCIHTFNSMLNFLKEVCHSNIVLCTATQPALAKVRYPVCYSEPKYMIRNIDTWFRRFERVKIHTPALGEKYTFESLGEEVVRQMEYHQSILVILNTKSAVGKLYDILKSFSIHVEYLTTNLCAEHRSDRIKSIKKTLKDKQEKIVVVSTNLIEAGVDISFECVYRSLTGLDSLAQSAGRCNRNGEMETGILHFVELENENTGNMDELPDNVRVTKEILNEYNNNGGGDSLLLPEWMNRYYEKIYLYMQDKMNFPIVEMDRSIMELLSEGFPCPQKKDIMRQAYKTAGQEYRVIDDYSIGVIVPYKKGRDILEAIRQVSNPAELKQYIRKAQRYTVNVRKNLLGKYEGLIQSVSEDIPDLYMVSAPDAYSMERGITTEWEPLII